MNIVVLVKQVPDTYAERSLRVDDGRVDRAAADAVLDEIDERAIEAALALKDVDAAVDVTVLTMGPDAATEALLKALSMGADRAVHVTDTALTGSDAVATACALAAAIGTLGDVDMVVAGNESSDGGGAAVPAMVADLLGVPALTHARALTVDGAAVTVRRETGEGVVVLTADLPVVVSVGEKLNEPRYPSFKGIMAAKKKPLTVLAVADLESGDPRLSAADLGRAGARSAVSHAAPRPPRSAGVVVEDGGDGGALIAGYLIAQKLV